MPHGLKESEWMQRSLAEDRGQRTSKRNPSTAFNGVQYIKEDITWTVILQWLDLWWNSRLLFYWKCLFGLFDVGKQADWWIHCELPDLGDLSLTREQCALTEATVSQGNPCFRGPFMGLLSCTDCTDCEVY